MSASVGFGFCLEQRRRRHDHAGLAVAALRHVEREPGLLHRMRAVRRQALDRDDLLLGRDGARPAATQERVGDAVDVDRAGAALRRCRSRTWCRSGRAARGAPRAAACPARPPPVRRAVDVELGHRLLLAKGGLLRPCAAECSGAVERRLSNSRENRRHPGGSAPAPVSPHTALTATLAGPPGRSFTDGISQVDHGGRGGASRRRRGRAGASAEHAGRAPAMRRVGRRRADHHLAEGA